MTARRAVLYSVFAVAATLMNFGAQALTVRVWPFAFELQAAVIIGTLAGLVVKYVLDKRYIFRFTTESLSHDGRLFVLYGLMSVATTIVFWSSEFGFDAVFGTEAARYAGGALGLMVGYVVKYQLDRRFVFRSLAAATA